MNGWEYKELECEQEGMNLLQWVIKIANIKQKGLKRPEEKKKKVGWLVWFYGISAFVGYLMPNPFSTNNQFYLKQFSLAWVHSLIVKNISISNYSVYSNSSNSTNSI